MKGWTERQIFFVFDTEYCQNEEDDPQDAIVYFRPQVTSESIRCTLCCQLMGISRFLKCGFSPVSLIRMEKGKFAIRALGKYHLALKGNPDMPDSILQRQIDRLVNLFTFYYKDFEYVQKECLGSRQLFLEKMTFIWNMLIPISQHGGNTLHLTFSLVPSIDLPKTAGTLHLQAAQLLEACQWHNSVLFGCMMCNKSVLHSQLPTSILHNISFSLLTSKVLPGELATVNYDIPGGIVLTYIYLTQRELTELSESSSNKAAAAAAVSKTSNWSLLKKIEKLNVTEADIVHSTETLNQECLHINDSDEIIDSVEMVVDRPHSSRTSPSPSPSMNKDFSSTILPPSSSSDESSAENFEELQNQNTNSNSLNVHVVTKVPAAATGIRALDDASSSLSNDEPVEMPVHDVHDADDERQSVESPESESECYGHGDELCRVVLYVQHCNDAALVLLMDESVTNEADVIHALWQLGLQSLTALEKDVKNCMEMRPFKDGRGMSRYHYIQYDKKWQAAKGHLHSPEKNLPSHHSFSRNVQLIHEEFRADPNLHEMTLRAKENVIYGHQMGSKETFYQPHASRTGKSDDSNNAGAAGMPFPHHTDPVSTVSETSRYRLETDLKLVLL